MRCLVTGADGFIASFLVDMLLERDHTVSALAFTASPHLDRLGAKVKTVRGDILDRPSLARLLTEVRPEVVFHLAAQSLPNVSWDQPDLTCRVNVLGTVHLLEAIRAESLDPVVVVPASSSEYAPSPDGRPVPETAALRPSSLYAVSKLAQDELSRLYHEHYGLRVVRARPFHLVGPRKTGDMSSDFARHIVAVEHGLQKDMPVGSLDVVRDLLDVRDGAEAFLLLAEHGRAGDVYNICSGHGVRAGEVLDMLKAMAKVPIRERQDPAKLRPIEDKIKVGDPSKLMALGWKPKRALQETLRDVLDYWRVEA